MTSQTVSPDGVLRFTLACIVTSVVAAIAFVVGGHIDSIRAPVGGVGIAAALFGSGVALWFALRARDRRFAVAAALSVLPLAYWSWALYRAQELKPDIGPRIDQYDRPSTGTVEPVPLGDTQYEATLCVSHYTDKADDKPDFVTIEVDKKHERGSAVCFLREFRADEVPAAILSAKTKDVVTYDQKSRTVTFRIGPRTFRYKLPEHADG